MTPIFFEKDKRGHPLTDEQKENNRLKSKVRSRVEYVFGFMEQTMGGVIFQGFGMKRAKANIAQTNIVYNMCRLVQNHELPIKSNYNTINIISNY